MGKLSASILSSDFGKLTDEVQAVEQAGADWIHVDVMDGHFVPNITIGPDVVRAIRKATKLPLDVHLMIENPERYLQAFVDAGADWLGVHVEACVHLHRTIQNIKELGIKATVTFNPATSLAGLEYILGDVDMVLLMTVNPGFGGQSGWADPATGISFGYLTNGFDRNQLREGRRRVALSSLAASGAA